MGGVGLRRYNYLDRAFGRWCELISCFWFVVIRERQLSGIGYIGFDWLFVVLDELFRLLVFYGFDIRVEVLRVRDSEI